MRLVPHGEGKGVISSAERTNNTTTSHMEEQTSEELYCGIWEGMMTQLEQGFQSLLNPRYEDFPYSLYRKKHIFARRQIDLFKIFLTAMDMRESLEKTVKEAKEKIEHSPLSLNCASNIEDRLNRICSEETVSVLRTLYCSTTLRRTNIPQPDKTAEIDNWYKLVYARSIVLDMSVAAILDELLKEIRLIRNIAIDYRSKDRDEDIAVKIYDSLKSRAKHVAYKIKFQEALDKYIETYKPDATYDALTQQDMIKIHEAMRDEATQRLEEHPKWGLTYKQFKRASIETKHITNYVYHETGSKAYVTDLALREICCEKIEEIKQEMEQRKKMAKQAVDECMGRTDSTKPARPFKERLQDAYAEIKFDKSTTDRALLLAALCASNLIEKDENEELEEDVRSVPDFLKLMDKLTDYECPEDDKNIQDQISKWNKKSAESCCDVFQLQDMERLISFVTAHYNNPNDKRTKNTIMKAEKIYNILTGKK